ncbi:adenylate kinase 1, chloroplastic isoform X2 [Ziziphus jujuba]|uniref:adenylate kinase n=1 Tax=Ziziphus jujuba TaxID=326968 RepID=A0ABM3I6L3_ZIZJJ|nr:adenylate kinase 1, chloroplastic isoform X2 [Ziziphus jujuba]
MAAALTRLTKPASLAFSSVNIIRRCFSSAVAVSETNNAASYVPPFVLDSNRPRKDPKDRNVQWVFLGCPGVGKGTYASRLCNLLGVPHIATGDLVREELASSGPLSQQEILEGVTDIDLVVNLKLQEDILIDKCLGRRICSQCGGNFNVASINVKGENGKRGISMAPLLPPPHCMSKLITRSDDTEAVVKQRLRIYNEKSQPVEEFYRSQGKLLEFDLPGGIPESWPKLLQVLNLDDEEKQSAAA